MGSNVERLCDDLITDPRMIRREIGRQLLEAITADREEGIEVTVYRPIAGPDEISGIPEGIDGFTSMHGSETLKLCGTLIKREAGDSEEAP